MSSPVRSTALLITAIVLSLGATACGADNPPGTLSEDELPGSVKVAEMTRDVQAGQVTCSQVNDAEDNHVLSVSDNSDPDREAAVSYRLEGSHRETVSSSTWRLPDPQAAVAAVSAGLDECIKAHPEVYRRFEVTNYPGGVGYVAKEGEPPIYTRRLVLPLSDRVVIVSTTRQGDDHFAVPPEDVLNDAVNASGDAPKA